jgi:hypothetical protein
MPRSDDSAVREDDDNDNPSMATEPKEDENNGDSTIKNTLFKREATF